ncbi:MAG: sugar phosphate isomerase/epimerase [Clostridiales bacterium]|nr:sugar phosphate isomerase/epimerase [Clostridiales bacterium]
MKKSISIWSFVDQENIRGCMETAKKAGFDGIELALTETGAVSMQSTREELTDIRKIAADLGIEISGVATGLYWQYSMTADDAATRGKAMDACRRQIETASILGVDGILVIPGAVGVDFIPDFPVVDYDKAYDRALEAIKTLSRDAEAHKVNIGLENVWNKFLLSPVEMRDFIDKIGSDYVGSYFDVGNVLYSGYPEHWVRVLGKRIKRVHFKDYRRAAGGLHGFVDLLSGDVNWPEVMRAFKEVGYDGWCTAEMLPPYTHYPDRIIFNTANSMSRILGGK